MIEPFECIYRIRRTDAGQWWNGGSWSQTPRSYTSLRDVRRTVSRCAPQFKDIPLEIVSFRIVEHCIHCVEDYE